MDNMAIAMGKRQLVDSIWKSAGIEGLGTTFPNTEKILDDMPVKTTKSEVLFIINMKRGWEFIFDNMEYPNNLMFLKQMNKTCMENLSYDAGNVRTVPVAIGGTSWTPEMPNAATIMEDLDRINENNDKLDAALEIFCYITRSQMFLDGNKRTAQLVTNKMLMENDIGILSIPYDKIDKFKEELLQFYESGNNSSIKTFFKENCLLLNPEYGINRHKGQKSANNESVKIKTQSNEKLNSPNLT